MAKARAFVVAAALLLACQQDSPVADPIYVVGGKPVPSIVSSHPVYAAMPDFKAMATNDDGTAYLSVGQCSPTRAIEKAMADCRDRSTGQTCKLLAVGPADVSGLGEAEFPLLVRQHSRTVATLRQRQSRSMIEIPVTLAGENVPYIDGFARGQLYYDDSLSCVGTVVAQTEAGLVCNGVWQFGQRVYAPQYPAEGDLDFECSNGARMIGTYVTYQSGYGAARLTDDQDRLLYAIYGPDVAAGSADTAGFLRLWRQRASHSPDAAIFDRKPALQ